MLTALLEALEPLGYRGMYVKAEWMDIKVRNEFRQPHPRRLLVSEHNRITRAYHPTRSAVIADTIRDGYEQMTSFCRYVKKVPNCDDQLIKCLRSKNTISQIKYRWAGNEEEDEDTYIDLPLSSAHPALSTTVFRTVFPNAILRVQAYNVVNSSCPESEDLRATYRSLYRELDLQVLRLRRRMLVLAGYPPELPKGCSKCKVTDLVDAAEKIERLKYGRIFDDILTDRKQSDSHKELSRELHRWWAVAPDGSLMLKSHSSD